MGHRAKIEIKIDEIAAASALLDYSVAEDLATLDASLRELAEAIPREEDAIAHGATLALIGYLERFRGGGIRRMDGTSEMAIGQALAGLQALIKDNRPLEETCFPTATLGFNPIRDVAPPENVLPVEPPPPLEAKSAPKMPVDLTFSPETFEADPELMADFLNESQDYLTLLDEKFLALEKDATRLEDINAVFRALHTMKGLAGFIGLEDVRLVCHEFETMMDQARARQLELKDTNIELAFEATDTLKKMTTNVRDSLNGNPLSETVGDIKTLIDRFQEATERKPKAEKTLDITESLIPLFVSEAMEHMNEVENQLLRLVKNAHDQDAINAIFRAFHTIKSGAALIGQKEISAFANVMENFLDGARSGQIPMVGTNLDIAFNAQSVFKAAIAGLNAAFESGAVYAFPDVRKLTAEIAAAAETVGLAPAGGKGLPADKTTRVQDLELKGGVHEMLKIDPARLDILVDTIGELVIAVSMLMGEKSMSAEKEPRIFLLMGRLTKTTRSLQEMGTSLRVTPIKGVFQKMARLARDLSRKNGKPIDLVTIGEDTEMDKSLVDGIGDPLVHMVRNAIDHGIESTIVERAAAGKPERGKITLRAFHKGSNVFIEVEDDGRGLSKDRILRKAIEKGVIAPDANPDEKEIFDLIFAPGFSTAEKVTDISGRGVGMDVVKKNVEALRGVVDIRSVPGKGSVFSVRLPLTLAIIDGMIARVGPERYIVPTLSVVRAVKPAPGEISTLLREGQMFEEQGQLIPLVSLRRLFEVEEESATVADALVLIAEDERARIGLVVTELLGQEQIVIKSLGSVFRDLPGIAGGAILADGQVGLILDVSGLIKLTHLSAAGQA